ncbi:hypothetical protein J7L67_06100 [bacterium]|nr:hypothetical protein [bacterium]
MNNDSLGQNNKLLKTLILNSLTQIDKNINVIDFGLGSKEFGYIDIFAIDSMGAFLLVNIFIEQDPELVDLLNKYKFVMENMVSLKSLYPLKNISVNANPEIILISGSFSSRFRRSLEFIESISITLFTFSYSMSNGIKRLNLNRVSPDSNLVDTPSSNIETLRQQLRKKSGEVDDKEIDTFIQFYE